MATQVHLAQAAGQGSSLGEAVDRWFFVGMALFLVTVILVGFVPDSFLRIEDIAAGGRGGFLWQAHFHALTMASWMALLLAQTLLMATGRGGWHGQLGVLGMVLAPLLVIAGVMLVPANFAARVAFAQGAGESPAEIAQMMRAMTNTAAMQLRSGFCFAVLVGLGFAARGRDAGLHKRLIILATIAPIGAAFARMPFLWNSGPASPLSTLLWPTLCLVPMLAWDLARGRGVHRAYWIYLAVMVPTGTAVMLAWNNPAWQAFARPLLGG
ncbi:hypothetical protein ACLBKU_12300 [Erythrobacter sp. NE805]|uniref:hypothetical protein n=1 Tax=Erythrobacter sp. NE805 TaxID=3389875 RepID=UPI00396B25B4